MDSVKTALDANISASESLTNTLYYGVYTPSDKEYNNSAANVFQDKIEALKLAKKNKKSRFKAFQFYHEAAEFAINGSECPNNNTTVDGPLFQKKTESQQNVGEKGSPFKAPKPQELVQLRKAIEGGNLKYVIDIIWQNPRYLVSSGDTPSILQEGARYNALHVAAKSKNAAITELILNTVSNVEFIKLLYGDENHQNAEDRTKILLDLYLNTPNKGLNETPLHFASKHGSAEVVEILVSYPQCDKTLRNRFQKTADQIICENASSHPSAKTRIKMLLQDSYYVPVFRTEDNSLPPLIGEPFSPTQPPVLNLDPLSPRQEITAYAGPMDKQGAQKFRKIWKTPPRSLKFNNSHQGNLPADDLGNFATLRYKDPEKGLERIGKKLANKYDVSWKEFWPFLNCFIDIASEEGLELLERHLAARLCNVSASHSAETRENSPVLLHQSACTSPMSNLCNAFQAFRLQDHSDLEDGNKSDVDPLIYIDTACQVFANRICKDILCDYEDIAAVLETEIKKLELLVTSYQDDNRFAKINFQKVHARLGALVGRKLAKSTLEEARVFLCQKMELLLDTITKSLDCFSSDDEGNHFKESLEQRKPTMYRKQIICLMHFTLGVLTQSFVMFQSSEEKECVEEWNNTEECSCAYHLRRFKKNNSLTRSGSFKNNSKFIMRNDVENLSRKLSFDEEDDDHGVDFVSYNNSVNHQKNGDLDYSSDEDFYTPPTSPHILENSDSEDEFNDTELPKYEIYIEGEVPTKTDCTVFNVLKHSECFLDEKEHPNIYKWRHNVGLFSESDRGSWPSPDAAEQQSPNCSISAWSAEAVAHSSTPSKTWMRITGVNSPRARFNKSNHV